MNGKNNSPDIVGLTLVYPYYTNRMMLRQGFYGYLTHYRNLREAKILI